MAGMRGAARVSVTGLVRGVQTESRPAYERNNVVVPARSDLLLVFVDTCFAADGSLREGGVVVVHVAEDDPRYAELRTVERGQVVTVEGYVHTHTYEAGQYTNPNGGTRPRLNTTVRVAFLRLAAAPQPLGAGPSAAAV